MDNQVELLVRLAIEAGSAIRKIYDEGPSEATIKEDRSPLTCADLASNNIILEGLKRLTPRLPFLSEESKDVSYEERKEWRKFWLIDPLDGTKEFLSRNGEFSVNIALVENGAPKLGVVHLPMTGQTYFGERGIGAFKQSPGKDPVMIRVSPYQSGPLKVVVSRFHAGSQLDEFLNKISDFESKTVGSSLKFCLVAEGKAHLYPRFWPTMEWDTAAAQCILEAAGGSVTDLSRRPLTYNKPDLTNPAFIAAGFPPFPWWKFL